MGGKWWLQRLTLVAVVIAAMECGGVGGKVITVGGKHTGWAPYVNYTDWARSQSFQLGDWLMFRYNKYVFDVLEVNKTNYEHCNSQHYITNITRGGRDVFELNETRTYYFICSKGYCYDGMKLAITVKDDEKPPIPAPKRSGAGHRLIDDGRNRVCINVMLGFFVCLALWFMK